MSLKMDDVLYVAYRTPELNYYNALKEERYDLRFDKKIDQAHVTLAFKPSEEKLTKIFQECRLNAKFSITHYGLGDKNEGVGIEIKSSFLENDGKQPHITLGVARDGKPVETANLNFVPFKKSIFSKKITDIQNTEKVHSVRRPKWLPETIEGVLSVRLKDGKDGKERWMDADEFVKQRQGYTVHVSNPLTSELENNQTRHFHSLQDCEAWCTEYLQRLNEKGDFKEVLDIVCSGDVRGEICYHADDMGVTKTQSDFWDGKPLAALLQYLGSDDEFINNVKEYYRPTEPAPQPETVLWDDFLDKFKVSVSAEYGPFPLTIDFHSKQQCVDFVANNCVSALCDNNRRIVLMAGNNKDEIGEFSIVKKDGEWALQFSAGGKTEQYDLPKHVQENISNEFERTYEVQEPVEAIEMAGKMQADIAAR